MTKPSNPWPSIDPSRLRHQISIQQQSTTQDRFGAPSLTWTTVRTTSGGLNVVSLKEAFGDGQLTAQETDIWTVRWTAGIQPGMQIVFGSNTWKVQDASNVMQRNITLHLLCLLLNAGS